MPRPIDSFRSYLSALDPKIQAAFALALFLVAGITGVQTAGDVQRTFVALCDHDSLSQCYARLEKAKEGDKETEAFLRQAAEARQAAAKTRQDLLSRTRLAEAEWGKPYRGPVTMPFADHSVTKIPACPPGERATFSLELEKPLADGGIEFPQFGGYWLFDLYRHADGGKVYPRSPRAGALTVFCQPVAAPQGGRP